MIFKTPIVTNEHVPVTLKFFILKKGYFAAYSTIHGQNLKSTQTTTCTILKICYIASLKTCNPAADTVAMSVHFLSPKTI